MDLDPASLQSVREQRRVAPPGARNARAEITASGRPRPRRIMDRYLLGRTYGPMGAVLTTTMIAFLMERLLRSLDLLAQSSDGFTYLVELMVNLAPHYLGLVLPVGFFIALFVVVNRLNTDSEIDAMQASGMSLGRISAPFIGLGLMLMILSLLLYGFVQPYSRYGYRMVLHAAENAGWSGQVKPRAIFSPDPSLILTAEGADPTGEILDRVFIRRLAPSGQEVVFTASTAEIRRNQEGRSATLILRDGQQLSTNPNGTPGLLTFTSLTLRLPLVPPARLLRHRGIGEETELTLVELANRGFGAEPPALPRQTLLAELYSRLARAIVLPLMPLLAVPFGLTAKRVESRAAFAIAGILLFVFQVSLLFGQGMADKAALPAAIAIGVPFAGFAAIAIATFVSSQQSPGENPVNRLTEWVSDGFQNLCGRIRRPWFAR